MEDPYRTPRSDTPAPVRCRFARRRLPGTRHLASTNAAIDPVTGEMKFCIIPEWGYPAALVTMAFSAVWIGPGCMWIYPLVYALVVICGARPVSLPLGDQRAFLDFRGRRFAFLKRRKGRDYSISFQLSSEVLAQLEHHGVRLESDQLRRGVNLGWHAGAVGVFALSVVIPTVLR